MALSFETMTPAGQFGDACIAPTLDLRKLCADDVLRSIPNFMYRWEDGTTLPIITNSTWSVARSADECDPSLASAAIQDCTVILPDQRLVSIGFAELPYRDTLQRFCNASRIERFPTLFDSGGNFRTGAPVADRFIKYLLSELRYPMMKWLQEKAWTGDQTLLHEFQGITPQLDDGPLASGGGCELYRANILDWNALTDGTGLANPAATIDAASDIITLQGVDFAGMTGLNLAELLRLWMERLINYDLAAWSNEEVELELWVPRGQENCILELAACMQPCVACTDPMSDPTIRDRASQFIRDRRFWLYPYSNITINVLSSPALTNRIVLLPKTIGGSPTIGWVFRDQDEEMGILSGELPWYGTQTGLPDTTMVYPGGDDPMDRGDFEASAFSLHLTRNGNCIQAFLNTEAAILIFSPQMYLVVDNVNCASLIPATCVDDMPVAATNAVNGTTGVRLSITVPALETALGFTPAAGDTFVVAFNDGVTQLIGTTISYTTGTDALILEFASAIVYTDYAGDAAYGPASVMLLAQN